MEYISSKQAAKKWRLSVRQVQICCAKGKIPGVKYMGKQWIIPKNATKPIDRRTKKAKGVILDTQYHFPFMIFTPVYASHEECTDSEMVLLKAQNLHLQGDFVKSSNLARYVLKNATESYIAMGAYCTIAYNYLFQEDFTNLKIALLEMNNLCKKESIHSEDFKLLIEGFKYHLTFNGENILKLDPSQMSSEGLVYFEYLINLVNACGPTLNPETDSLRTALFTKRLDIEGLEPSLLMMAAISTGINCILAGCYSDLFVMQVCKDISKRNNWASYYDRTMYVLKRMLDAHNIDNDIQPLASKQHIDCWQKNIKLFK